METEMDPTMRIQSENGHLDAGPFDNGGCPRCGGFMVQERYIDLLDDTGQLEFTADRCVQCGEVVDQTILANRQASRARVQPPLAKVA